MHDPLDISDPRTLRAAREARGLTISALAKAAGVLPSTITRIETEGNDPRTRTTWVPIVSALTAAALQSAAA